MAGKTNPFPTGRLSRRFKESELTWRVQSAGKTKTGNLWAKVLAYVDARALRKRLNEVLGPENWQQEFRTVGNGVICKLWLRWNGEWIYKEDGAGETGFEAVKGGYSDAFKRACYSWGLGEYLYDLDVDWAEINEKGVNYSPHNKKTGLEAFNWNPPELPGRFKPGISETQHKSIEARITELGLDRNIIKDLLRINTMYDIPEENYQSTLVWLTDQGVRNKAAAKKIEETAKTNKTYEEQNG